MPNWLRQILTGSDNQSHDVIHYGIIFGYISLVGLQWFSIAKGQPFRIQDCGIALAAYTTACGAALGLGAKEQPKP